MARAKLALWALLAISTVDAQFVARNQPPGAPPDPTAMGAISSSSATLSATLSAPPGVTSAPGTPQSEGKLTEAGPPTPPEPDSQTSTPASAILGTNKKAPPGAIAGGVVGGVVVLALVGFLGFFLLRRRKNQQYGSPYAPKGQQLDSIAVIAGEKSRASSPTTTSSPYNTAPPPGPVIGSLPAHIPQQQAPSQPQPPPVQVPPSGSAAPTPPPPPPAQALPPQELASREVDEDGVSVRSFELEDRRQQSVPRLPIYNRPAEGGTPL